jgi:hypothetical protein
MDYSSTILTHESLREHPESWKQAVEGYELVKTIDQLRTCIGGTVRYVTKAYERGQPAGNLEFRLGGILVTVDAHNRYFVVKNPKAQGRKTWSVQMIEMRDGTPIVQMWDDTSVKAYKQRAKRGAYQELMVFARPPADPPQTLADSMHDLLNRMSDGRLVITKRP